MDNVYITFDSIESMTSWMKGVMYEGGERGQTVRFNVMAKGKRWLAKVV